MGGCPLSRPGARTLGPAWRLVVTALLLATPAPCVGRTGARRATSFGSHKTANPVGQRRYQYIYEYRSTPWGGWLEHGICALGDSTRPATFVGSVVRIGYLLVGVYGGGVFAGAARGSRGSQFVLNSLCDRVRDPFRVLERRHGLVEIVERGAVVGVLRRGVGVRRTTRRVTQLLSKPS